MYNHAGCFLYGEPNVYATSSAMLMMQFLMLKATGEGFHVMSTFIFAWRAPLGSHSMLTAHRQLYLAGDTQQNLKGLFK